MSERCGEPVLVRRQTLNVLQVALAARYYSLQFTVALLCKNSLIGSPLGIDLSEPPNPIPLTKFGLELYPEPTWF